jgi:hypothetical protein
VASDTRRNLDAIACIALACAALASIALFSEPPALLTVLIGAPLALLAPGYALVLALFPRHTETRMRKSTRLMFSLGMSVVCNILLTLVLNFTAYGIHRVTLTAGLAAITLALSLIAIQRGNALPPATRAPEEAGWKWPTAVQGSVAALSIAIAAGAFTLATREAQRVQTLDVLQLWMLPVPNQAPGTVSIGVRNINAATSDYLIALDRDGYVFERFEAVSAPAGSTWVVTKTLAATDIGRGPIVAQLYSASDPSVVLRRVQYALSESGALNPAP